MRITKVGIRHFRSVENMEICFPENCPVVLFGANQSGKTNIMEALDRLLGDTYPTHRDLKETDKFLNGTTLMNTAEIQVKFDSPLYRDAGLGDVDALRVVYGAGGISYNNLLYDGRRRRIHPTDEERGRFQSIYLRSDQSLETYLSGPQGLLRRMIQKICAGLGQDQKSDLISAYEEMRKVFTRSPEYTLFSEAFSSALSESLSGFLTPVSREKTGYELFMDEMMGGFYPQNAYLGDVSRLTRGEQQVLILSLLKAWSVTFPDDHFLLMIEEPENHLHPLAQKWLHEFLEDLCAGGIQVLISTHSTDFIEAAGLNGLVRIYRENGITRARQLSPGDLYNFCIQSGASRKRISRAGIIDFYAIRLSTDQLRGLFSETVLLVEGATEYFALPEFFRRIGFSLPACGVEIINCEGKSNIPLYARLFQAYGYHVYCLFDGDEKTVENTAMFRGLVNEKEWATDGERCVIRDSYAYFGKDFETYFRSVIEDWESVEKDAVDLYRVPSKPGVARGIAIHCKEVPEFFYKLAEKLSAFRA